MQSIELTEEMLKTHGWAYLFDLSQVDAKAGEDLVNEHIRNIYISAIEALTKQRSKKLKKGPFVIWNCLKRVVGDNIKVTLGLHQQHLF